MRIIVDVMGSDNGPAALTEGVVLAARELSCEFTLVGDAAVLEDIVKKEGLERRIEVVHAPQVIEMEEKAATAFLRKKDSSMSVALELMAGGKGDALVSAGSTGALLSGATFILKRIRGIRRAALAPVLPTKEGRAILIDSGANVECTPEQLVQFAFMGHFYAKSQFGLSSPRVALVNVGSEAGKGSDLLKETYHLLSRAGKEGKINFIGNVEGRGVPYGEADVFVCDGLIGNVLLKTFEGVALYLIGEIRGIFKHNMRTKLAALSVRKELRAFRNRVDYKEVGGAPLLGVSKPVIKAHGSSDARAMRSAILQAYLYAESGVIAAITRSVEEMGTLLPDRQEQDTRP